jgi:hypothetical protein
MKKIITLLTFVFTVKILFAQTFTAGNIAVLVAAASASNTTGTIVELNTTTAGQAGVNTYTIPSSTTTLTNQLRISGSATSTAYLANSNDGSLLCFTGGNTIDGTSNINSIITRGVGTFNAAGTYNLATTYSGTSGNQTRSATTIDNTNWYVGDQGGFYTNSATSASPSGNIRGVKSFGGIVYAFTASASLAPVGTISAASGGTFTALSGLPVGASSRQDFYLVSSGSNGSSFDVLYILDATSGTAGTIFKYSLVSGTWTDNGSYTTSFGGFGLAAKKNGTGANLYVTTGTGATTANSVIKLIDAAGYNATISITTGNNVTLYTTATGTIIKGVAFAPAASTPLNLVSFNASLNNNNTVNVWWATVNELNTAGFEIQRSTDAINFTADGFVAANNKSSLNNYNYVDAKTISRPTYYRLKMTDKDGTFSYSNVVKVSGKTLSIINVYPNPATNNIIVSHAGAQNGDMASILTAEGKVIKSIVLQSGATTTAIDVSNLAKGIYFVRVQIGSGYSTSCFNRY